MRNPALVQFCVSFACAFHIIFFEPVISCGARPMVDLPFLLKLSAEISSAADIVISAPENRSGTGERTRKVIGKYGLLSTIMPIRGNDILAILLFLM